jgi:hypothetical protein
MNAQRTMLEYEYGFFNTSAFAIQKHTIENKISWLSLDEHSKKERGIVEIRPEELNQVKAHLIQAHAVFKNSRSPTAGIIIEKPRTDAKYEPHLDDRPGAKFNVVVNILQPPQPVKIIVYIEGLSAKLPAGFSYDPETLEVTIPAGSGFFYDSSYLHAPVHKYSQSFLYFDVLP